MPKSDLILIAIEDKGMVPMFERALAAASYKVAVAHDRETLDTVLQESIPALIILSESFKGHVGIKLTEELLERFPTLPVILFVTQTLPLITIKDALRVGISDMISPPLKINDIMKAVENSLMRASRIGDWTRREVRKTTASLERRINELVKMETIIDHIDDGVMILDEKLNILLINPAMRRSFGLWQEEYNGQPVLDIITNPDLRTMLLENKDNISPHNEITFDDGRVYNAQYTPIPGIGVAVTIQDITYLHQIDRLKSEFINTVSHDLRSPLTAILGYVELLERVGPINDAQRDFIGRVQASVQSITALVNDLLELGRIEAGVDSQKEIVPLNSIIQLTLENYETAAADKGIRLELIAPEDKMVEIRGNPIRLRQMMDNLLGNAIKYTPDNGEVSVELEEQSEQVIIRIADTGPGIPPADQSHIFERFYRATNVPKGVGGSGLGLAIVKSIVGNHNGRIWVESILGKGSTFVVVLPMYKLEKVPPSGLPKGR